MRIRVPVIVKDPEVSDWKDVNPTEQIEIETEDLFLDGPVSSRVAVLDFDPRTNVLRHGARFVRPNNLEGYGEYAIPEPVRPGDMKVSPVAAAVHVFGAVHKTIRLFEEPDALGRRIAWAFDGDQLLVVPNAGEWANAYYERESHSLQFFAFRADGREIHTSHSQDIVAHETAHAILDGVAPDLYHAITPQALAIHEAIADLTAVLCCIRCRELSRKVIEQTQGDLRDSNVFNGIAEQFAGALHQNRDYLRNLLNNLRLDEVSHGDPHALSEVLSGALYAVFLRTYEELRDKYSKKQKVSSDVIAEQEDDFVQQAVMQNIPEPSGASTGGAMKALFVAGERFKRTIFRGLDYLPPGDVTFADLARSILAADAASHPDSGRQREWLIEEFVKRRIVDDANQLEVRTGINEPAVQALDLDSLIKSDYVAYQFADKNRYLLGIPVDTTFEVRPRLDMTKLYWHRDGKKEMRECLFKVAWTEEEPNDTGPAAIRRRRYVAGTTLAIDWESRNVRALLSSSRGIAESRDRSTFLKTLFENGLLAFGEDALGPGGLPLRGTIQGDVFGETLRVRGTARMLHVTSEYSR
jgi:hypothetical protein